MNSRSIPKIARWGAAAVAIAIALAVVGIFAHRSWLAKQAMRHAPAAVPPSVEQRSFQFTFSRVEGQQTVFTIRAARATRFSGKKSSVLDDVDIVVYGVHGNRHDEIHTRSCDYQASTQAMVCRGKVELDLANAPVRTKPGAKAAAEIHVDTRGVRFDGKTGDATTDAPLTFQFPAGRGSAVGVAYSSRKATMTLGSDVDLTLTPSRPGGLPAQVKAKDGLTYNRTTGKLLLSGPVTITKGNRSLASSTLAVMLNKKLRPRVATAAGGVAASVNRGGQPARVRAEDAEILFDRQGRAKRVNASGDVVASQGQETSLKARQANVTLDPADQQPREVFASGDVRLRTAHRDSVGRLRSAALYLTMGTARLSAETPRRGRTGRRYGRLRLEQATTPGRAEAEWQTGKERLRLDAGRLSATFGGENEVRNLRGADGVKLDRQQAGEMPVRTTARTLRVQFTDGKWSRAEEAGGVHATQGNRRAEARRASWSRSRQEIALEGKARMHDPTGQTLADTIFWNQGTGRLRAEGDVRSTYFVSAGDGPSAAPSTGPVNVVAQKLNARPSTGEAIYSGGARMWQGELAIQAERIVLRRKSGELIATGDVRGAFPQVERQGGPKKGKAAARGNSESAVLWRVRSQELTYLNQAGSGRVQGGTATLDGGVKAVSPTGEIQARRLVLLMRRNARGRAELTQANGSGGVLVRQGKRWGRGERALYDAEQGKFVLSGARPSLHDTSGDLVTGSELTFYVADDRILVESAKGTRTLTRHPIHKKK